MTHVIFYSAEFVALSDNYLMARISGTKVEKFDHELKGVTTPDSDIFMNNNGNFKTNLIFDYR